MIAEFPETVDAEAFRLLFPLHLAIRELQSAGEETTGGTNSSHVYTYVAGQDVAAGKLIAMQNEKVVYASRSRSLPAIGISASAASAGEEVNVLMLGFIQLGAAFPSSVKYLYLGENGVMTSAPAGAGEIHQQVATVTGSQSVHFFPLVPIRRR